MKKLISIVALSFAAAAAIAQTPSPFTPAEQQSFISTFNAGGPYGGAIHTEDGQTVKTDYGFDDATFIKTFESQGPNGGAISSPVKASIFTPEEEKAFIETYKAGGPNGGAIHN